MLRLDDDDGHWFYIANTAGEILRSPSPTQVRGMLMGFERDRDEDANGEVWLAYAASDESITWRGDGALELRSPPATLRTLGHVSLERALEVFALFDRFHDSELEALPWMSLVEGVAGANQRAARNAATVAALYAAEEQSYLASLGPERPEEPCRHEGCIRGAVRHSVLCRAHHFEAIVGRPAPGDRGHT